MLMASRHRSPSPPLTPCPPRGSHEHAYDALVPSRTRLPLVSRFRASSSADAPAPRTDSQIAAFHSDLCSWCRRRRLRLVQQCESLLGSGAHCLSGGDCGLFADAGAHGRLHPHARAHRHLQPCSDDAGPAGAEHDRARRPSAGGGPGGRDAGATGGGDGGASNSEEAPAPQQPPKSAYYGNCTEAREAGAAPLYQGEPGYRPGMDRDHDGIACEWK